MMRVFLVAAALAVMTSNAAAESIAWRRPSGFQEQPMQMATGSGLVFVGTETDPQGIVRNYAYAEVPRAGNFIGRSIEQSARGILQASAGSCRRFEILDSVTSTIDGRNAVIVTR